MSGARTRRTRVVRVEVLLDDARGAVAILRGQRGRACLELPIPAEALPDAISLARGSHGTVAETERPSWPGLYAASLEVAGVAIESVEIDAVAGRLLGAITLRAPGGAETRLAAPVIAGVLVAHQSGAPLHVTAAALRHGRRRPQTRAAATTTDEPAGEAFLATLLASLPDEDFGEVH